MKKWSVFSASEHLVSSMREPIPAFLSPQSPSSGRIVIDVPDKVPRKGYDPGSLAETLPDPVLRDFKSDLRSVLPAESPIALGLRIVRSFYLHRDRSSFPLIQEIKRCRIPGSPKIRGLSKGYRFLTDEGPGKRMGCIKS